MREHIVDIWNNVMDARYNPLRNIPDLQVRHMVMQVLAFLWSLVFGLMITNSIFALPLDSTLKSASAESSLKVNAPSWSNFADVKVPSVIPPAGIVVLLMCYASSYPQCNVHGTQYEPSPCVCVFVVDVTFPIIEL